MMSCRNYVEPLKVGDRVVVAPFQKIRKAVRIKQIKVRNGEQIFSVGCGRWYQRHELVFWPTQKEIEKRLRPFREQAKAEGRGELGFSIL